jgi:hypothetical protein
VVKGKIQPGGLRAGRKFQLKAACIHTCFRDDLVMSASYKSHGPVTLSEEQVLDLHQKLRDMRHDVNGKLANIVAAAELIRLRPETAEERLKLLIEQPLKAADCIAEFSRVFEGTFGLTRR